MGRKIIPLTNQPFRIVKWKRNVFSVQ